MPPSLNSYSLCVNLPRYLLEVQGKNCAATGDWNHTGRANHQRCRLSYWTFPPWAYLHIRKMKSSFKIRSEASTKYVLRAAAINPSRRGENTVYNKTATLYEYIWPPHTVATVASAVASHTWPASICVPAELGAALPMSTGKRGNRLKDRRRRQMSLVLSHQI